MISHIFDVLAFQVQTISGPPSHSQRTHRVCSAVAGKRSECLYGCVSVCTFGLIDYRCTAGLVGFGRQWKWA